MFLVAGGGGALAEKICVATRTKTRTLRGKRLPNESHKSEQHMAMENYSSDVGMMVYDRTLAEQRLRQLTPEEHTELTLAALNALDPTSPPQSGVKRKVFSCRSSKEPDDEQKKRQKSESELPPGESVELPDAAQTLTESQPFWAHFESTEVNVLKTLDYVISSGQVFKGKKTVTVEGPGGIWQIRNYMVRGDNMRIHVIPPGRSKPLNSVAAVHRALENEAKARKESEEKEEKHEAVEERGDVVEEEEEAAEERGDVVEEEEEEEDEAVEERGDVVEEEEEEEDEAAEEVTEHEREWHKMELQTQKQRWLGEKEMQRKRDVESKKKELEMDKLRNDLMELHGTKQKLSKELMEKDKEMQKLQENIYNVKQWKEQWVQQKQQKQQQKEQQWVQQKQQWVQQWVQQKKQWVQQWEQQKEQQKQLWVQDWVQEKKQWVQQWEQQKEQQKQLWERHWVQQWQQWKQRHLQQQQQKVDEMIYLSIVKGVKALRESSCSDFK